ncbi:MAG: hypothetical protein V1936_00870 [Patescibacteria group bacterium]
MRKLKGHSEIFGIEILDREQLTPKIFAEILQSLNSIRTEIANAFGFDEYYFHFEVDRLIAAWQTILVRDTRSQLAAWASIHDDCDENGVFRGVAICTVFPKLRRKGIATLLAKKIIELCWQSSEVDTAQFNISWKTKHSEKALRSACKQLEIPWETVQKFSDLGSEMNFFRIPPRN